MIVLGIAAVVTLLVLAGTILMDVSQPLPTQSTQGPTPRIEQPTTGRDAQRQRNRPEPAPLPNGVLSG
jgi:hypothetical protein